MITITKQIYEDMADRLLHRIEETHFFNGSVEYDTEEFYSTLTCTLIICRDHENDRILSILPIWWEYTIALCDGTQDHDFCWSTLNEYLEKKI